jgi:uncharacterized protein YbjQ (UPF0145 family)
MARPFSSDLSVAEALVIREAGFTPIAQVMGSCFYQVGWQSMPWGRFGGTAPFSDSETFELETQTAAWNDARGLALRRLRDEAVAVGADAVVGMRLKRGGYEWAAGLVEFVAIGTAVRSERYEIEGAPVLSHLSGQDFAKLVSHGFWPVGLVAGSTVVYVIAGWQQNWQRRSWQTGSTNQELPDYTRGMYDARALAMERVTHEAHRLHAHGVVGVTIEHSEREREREARGTTFRDLIVELHVLGTAIVEVRHDTPPPTKYLALPLDREVP